MQCPYKPSLSRASYLISEACRVRLIRDIFDFTIPGDVVELIWIFKNTPDFAADNYSTITAPLKLNNFRSLSRQYARKTNVRLFCVALPVILEKQIIELKDNLASYTLFFTIIDKATSSIIKNITLIETRAAFNYRLWDQYKVVGRDTFSEIFERKANTIYSRFMLKIVNNKALVRYNTGLQSLNFKPPRR